jgi:AraC family transcriptional activator of mtrCDE
MLKGRSRGGSKRRGQRVESSSPKPSRGLEKAGATAGGAELPLDWLSRLLDIVSVRGVLELRCFYGAPWVIDRYQPLPGEIRYHIVLSGSAVLEDPNGGPPQKLAAGDILLVPRGAPHRLSDGSGVAASPALQRATQNLIISENSGPGERVDLLCGRFILSTQHERLLRDYMALGLVVHAFDSDSDEGAAATGRLRRLVELMRDESVAENLGGRALLNALSTALLALVLREAGGSNAVESGLLAIAAHPRLAPALSALFRQPARGWTLPQLAQLCHLSRATFARQFQDTLGHSAFDLLADIRMTLAANELRNSSRSTAAIGEMVGYQSDAAFQRTFKARMGVTPAQWRRGKGPLKKVRKAE